MLAWRIYYAGGTRFDSSMGAPDGAPTFGAICILQRSEDGANVDNIFGSDFYIHEEGRWLPVDEGGVWDRLYNRIPFCGLLVGRMLRNEQYREIYDTAKKDQDFYAMFTKEQIAEFLRLRDG